MATKPKRGRPTVHQWAELKQEFIEAKLADSSYSITQFAYDKGVEPSMMRSKASTGDWLTTYQNLRTNLDDRLLDETLTRHGAVMEKLRRKLIFTEQHVRSRAATFAGVIKGRIEESLLSVNWDDMSLKERREMYALMHEVEASALGITPPKHTVHHHLNHQARGPNGEMYLSADAHEESQMRRLKIAEKFLNAIEGSAVRVPEKRGKAA